MRSPFFAEDNLQPKEIESGLLAYECLRSGGLWIPLQSYEQWKAQQAASLASAPPDLNHVVPVPDDSKQPALICPESGVVML
jgi:hypothetical protein